MISKIEVERFTLTWRASSITFGPRTPLIESRIQSMITSIFLTQLLSRIPKISRPLD